MTTATTAAAATVVVETTATAAGVVAVGSRNGSRVAAILHRRHRVHVLGFVAPLAEVFAPFHTLELKPGLVLVLLRVLE